MANLLSGREHGHGIRRPAVFAGHCGYVTALAGYGYDIQAAAMNLPSTVAIPDASLAAGANLIGGLFEVFAPPVELPAFRKTATGFHVDYPPPLDRRYALDQAIAGIDALLRLERTSPLPVRMVRSVAELEEARMQGIFAAVLHLADADAIDVDLETLYLLHAAGLRSLAITWSRPNAFGYGAPYRSPGTPDIGPGLTDAGIRLVRACNELGIQIDLAHLNEAGFRDVASHSDAPLVVTHGAAHALSPTSRALTDAQLQAVAASGGVVGVSMEGVGATPDGIVGGMVRQIDYLLERLGPDGVALGSDIYRKPGEGCPTGALLLPELLAALEHAGHDRTTLDKITHANWIRVLGAAWR